MLVLNDSQALILENLLIRMLTNETYSVQQLEEALTWFQAEKRTVSCPMESTLAKSISEELFRLIRLNQE
ncbi:hypothetical protein HJG54_27240 [Leptolyngbya sp. NK1-12]|uniref:Uncharacterized protein n=1 Tax=Leptolyngbya sp. NK1-12 TaxID=2547451 RepID=A0AA96WHG8_9CYAN|nr:hypothetical protein [Leptolyngbya sp. NK1-12]WNZ26152.1 hypothetical protein HJG54_27240 [Leptolyngbya sp. NK1-12]